MIAIAASGGETTGGVSALLWIAVVVWMRSRLDHRSREQAARTKRKTEIEAIVKSRPEDADLFREVLNELGTDGTRGKT
ncbi:hypothetical protein KZO11_12140 [Streptomyces anulatus]|uniref:hypothetical protein n=1 Tax=Streptomyces anulatus TaxID=1892 RepID=UPI001C5DFDF2|nr:hypothetical protein [Streptomyces anulatus]QYA94401.1 hypothetical protein KZO11_12140 [Streptomyces anulatus]